jgi:predicted DCC family thiol-disulfide oxidoreductase YuxK
MVLIIAQGVKRAAMGKTARLCDFLRSGASKMTATNKSERVAVLYDGMCVICVNSVRLWRRLDWRKRLEFVDVQDWSYVQQRFPQIERDAALGAIHVIAPDGAIYTGYDGVRCMARYVPLLAWSAPLLGFAPIAWLGRRVYAWIARRRYAINRLFGRPVCDEACRPPSRP